MLRRLIRNVVCYLAGCMFFTTCFGHALTPGVALAVALGVTLGAIIWGD